MEIKEAVKEIREGDMKTTFPKKRSSNINNLPSIM